jgi:protein involved in polysaccharide export with SLBB domain
MAWPSLRDTTKFSERSGVTMKKESTAGMLLLASLLSFATAFAQTGSGSQDPKPAGNPVAGSPKKSSNSKSAKAQETASANGPTARVAADDSEKGGGPASTKSGSSTDEEALTRIYRVGIGDVLDIRLPSATTSGSTLFTVMDGGLIEFPLVGGGLAVGGLTTDEIQARLAKELKRRAVYDNPRLTVGVRQYASHPVIITGLVGLPGTKMLRREAVPFYVILADSQPRLDAGRATIMRAGRLAQTVDLSDASALSVVIKPGDVINLTVRPQEFYYIAGFVNYPGQKAFQSGITLLQSILAAGGLSRSTDHSVELSREGADGRLATTRYKLREIKAGKVRDPRLQAGDRIEVVR